MAKLLIVDDDAFTRIFLRSLVERNADIKIVGEAENGAQAIEMAMKLKPDVITMDVMMPGVNGLEATRKIMATSPCQIIMVSEFTQADSKSTLEALELGAVDFLSKSSNHVQFDIPSVKEALVDKILYWGKNRPGKKVGTFRPRPIPPKGTVALTLIGASTGGPQVLPIVLGSLTQASCPIVVAQLMPAMFTEPFVAQLQAKTKLPVVVGSSGMVLESNVVYVVPGGIDTVVKSGGDKLQLVVGNMPDTTSHPSIRALFESAAEVTERGIAVILTGKGRSVATGAKQLFDKGWPVLIQKPGTCVEESAPQAVLEAEAATEVLTPVEIGQRLHKWLG